MSDDDSSFVPSDEEDDEGGESNGKEWRTSYKEEVGNDNKQSEDEEIRKILVEDMDYVGIVEGSKE